MKKIFIVALCLFSLVDAAHSGYSKPVELLGFQKQFLLMVNKGNIHDVGYLIGKLNYEFLKIDVVRGQVGELPQKAIQFCQLHNHKHSGCMKIISDWIDENNDFKSIGLDLIKYGLCICNILNSFDGINWANFFREEALDAKIKADLRNRAISVIFSNLQDGKERTEKQIIETKKIINACNLSEHTKFKDMIYQWALDHNISIKPEWCLCHILKSNNHASVMDFAGIVAAARKTNESSPTTTPTSPNSSVDRTKNNVTAVEDCGC